MLFSDAAFGMDVLLVIRFKISKLNEFYDNLELYKLFKLKSSVNKMGGVTDRVNWVDLLSVMAVAPYEPFTLTSLRVVYPAVRSFTQQQNCLPRHLGPILQKDLAQT